MSTSCKTCFPSLQQFFQALEQYFITLSVVRMRIRILLLIRDWHDNVGLEVFYPCQILRKSLLGKSNCGKA